MNKKIIFSIIIFTVVFAFAGIVKIKAATSTGWLWGGSEDCDMDHNGFRDVLCGGNNTTTPVGNYGDGAINGNETGLGWISTNNTSAGGSTVYNLQIPDSNGDLSGYVWSSNIGWISFNADDLSGCPDTNCSAKRVDNDLVGWARILSIKNAAAVNNSGGWTGWIKLSGMAKNTIIGLEPFYGVSVEGNALHGYAWSDELGEISFNNSNIVCVPDYQYSCALSTIGACHESNCNTPIISQTAVCGVSDNNECSGALPSVSKQDCADHSVLCPDDVPMACPPCPLSVVKWREITP